MEDKIKCLYYIKDIRTDKIIYIGQTIDFKQRKYEHFHRKRRPIQLYMFTEGRENFIMEMFNIDCVNMSKDEMLQKEDELILQYDTINNGLNKNRSGLISKEENYDYFKRKKYYQNNKEYFKEYRQAEKWKEYDKEYNKQYYQKHKDQILERSKIYQQTEKFKDYQKQYYQEHKEKYREYLRQWRIKKKQEKMALSEG